MIRVLIVSLFMSVWSSPIFSMTCQELPLDESFKNADYIFAGEILKLKKDAYTGGDCWAYSKENKDCGGKVAHFKIQKVWKGNLKKKATVWAEDGCYCLGGYFHEGESYVVFGVPAAKKHKAEIRALSLCDGTTPLGKDPEEKIKKIDEMLLEISSKKSKKSNP